VVTRQGYHDPGAPPAGPRAELRRPVTVARGQEQVVELVLHKKANGS
jgi:hypothetical protein